MNRNNMLKQVGSKIKTLRQNNGLSKKVFCKILNLSSTSITLIENGKVDFSLNVLIKILETFNIQFDELIGENKNEL